MQRANRLVEKVQYVTCPGTKVSTLVTNEGVYVKDGTELTLKGYFPSPALSPEERVSEIARTCGWGLKELPNLEKLALPTLSELSLLRSFDPEKVFIK